MQRVYSPYSWFRKWNLAVVELYGGNEEHIYQEVIWMLLFEKHVSIDTILKS